MHPTTVLATVGERGAAYGLLPTGHRIRRGAPRSLTEPQRAGGA
ncbi:hypothetical protein [Streptomyces sp. NPDC017524]